MLAQGTTGVLIQRLHVIGHLTARDDAQVFDHLERKATGQPVQRLVRSQIQQRFKQRGNFAVNEMLQAALHFLRHIGPGFVIDKRRHLRFQRIGTGHQLAHRLIAPHKATLFGEINFRIGRVIEPIRAQMEMGGKRLNTCLTECLCLLPRCVLVLTEPEPFQTTDEFAFDGHFTLVIHLGQKGLLLFEPPQQHGCAPVHKSLRQTLMQRI